MKKQQHEPEEAERRLKFLGQRLRSMLGSLSDDRSEKIKDALRAQHEEETEGGIVKASKRKPEDR